LDGTTSDDADTYQDGWTGKELRGVLRNPTRAMGIVLCHLAANPDVRVDGHSLAAAVYGEGANTNQLGGALGSFTRRVSRDYGRGKWPFDAFRNAERKL
jgi:hypothetical protein